MLCGVHPTPLILDDSTFILCPHKNASYGDLVRLAIFLQAAPFPAINLLLTQGSSSISFSMFR